MAAFADVVVLAVPFNRYRELPVAELAGKPVIDTTNYDPRPRRPHRRTLDDDRITSSELVQRHLTGAHVVKAFNAIRWEHLRDHAHRDTRAARIPVSGDDLRAKKTAMALVSEIGFDAGRRRRASPSAAASTSRAPTSTAPTSRRTTSAPGCTYDLRETLTRGPVGRRGPTGPPSRCGRPHSGSRPPRREGGR